MHGPEAAILTLISQPSYLTLAVIGAIAVIVHETRTLLGSLSWTHRSSEFWRAARRAPHPAVTQAPDTARAPLAHCQSAPEKEPAFPGGPATPPSPRVVAASEKPSARRALPPRPRQTERGSTAIVLYVAGAFAITTCVIGLALLLLRSFRRLPSEPSRRALGD